MDYKKGLNLTLGTCILHGFHFNNVVAQYFWPLYDVAGHLKKKLKAKDVGTEL